MLAAWALFPSFLWAELLPIRAYTTADGLASDHVDGIVADSRGFLWFCTREGLTRFDGYRFVSYGTADGLAHGVVTGVVETRAGDYLVGTMRGISKISAGGGARFTTLAPNRDPAANRVSAIRQTRDGRIWCAISKGLYELSKDGSFERRELKLPTVGDDIEDIAEDDRGGLWVATSAGIFVLDDRGVVRTLTKADGMPGSWVNTLLRDSAGRIWAGIRGGLAMFRRQASGEWKVEQAYSTQNGLAGGAVYTLAESSDGVLWVGTGWGISRVALGDGEPRLLGSLGREQGLTDRQINSLAEDQAGNMWAATEGAGVMRINRMGFTTYREQDGLPADRVFSLLEDRAGELAAVTVVGKPGVRSVDLFDGARFHSVMPAVFNGSATWGWDRVLLQSRSGEWWAATQQGLCRLGAVKAQELDRKKSEACYGTGLVFRLFEDSKGGIWASLQTDHGDHSDELLRWDPGTKEALIFPPRVPGQRSDDLVSAFTEDRQGNIWMGLYKGGLYRYDGRQMRYFQRSDGVPGGSIQALLADAGGVWIGSNGGGLGRLTDTASDRLKIDVYNTARGLASNIILCLVEDRQGLVYAGTGRGLDRLDPKTGHIRHYTSADGLAHGDFTSALLDRSGSLWFATKQGLSRLTLAAERATAAPRVLITDLRIGGGAYPVSQLGATRLAPPELKPSENQLQVDFVGIDWEAGDTLRYSYQLEGADTAWSAPRTQPSVNFAALAGGTYRFRVKALTSEGVESTTPAEIDFTVLPPVWRRWWFESLAVALAAALVFAAHRYRVAQVVSLERMRTAIATDLHDDIGASLSQIAILSEVARVGGNGAERPDEPLERVAALARELVESMGDIVWSIRSEPQGMDSLVRRMREFAIDLLASQGVEFVLRAPELGDQAVLSLQGRRELFLIFKECIHNAARHSGCTAVTAELRVTDREVTLTVSDNGQGLTNGRRAPGWPGGTGIQNMRKRAEGLGGRMEVTSQGGVTVEVHLPRKRFSVARVS
jgi:ligand-binding sensor domain-containing protein/signal transduction histidine kinase